MADLIEGGCLCGGVRYEADGPLTYLSHCHCSRCRKWHGAATGPYTPVLRERFRFVTGEDLLRTYTVDGGGDRTFCSTCGSSLFYAEFGADSTHVVIAAGTLDGDPGVRPMLHIHVASKAPWHEITDDLPQLPGGSDG